MKIRTSVVGAIIASGVAVSALAHNGATGVVKERMDGMGVMGKGVKLLAPMMQGKVPLNPDEIRRVAEAIRGHSGETLSKLFVEGTDGKPSEAKPEIWSNWDEFAALANELHTFSEGLALAADNGLMMAASGQGSASLMGGSTMMGGASMMGGGAPDLPSLEALAEMPVDAVFNMVTRTCAACHTKFRLE